MVIAIVLVIIAAVILGGAYFAFSMAFARPTNSADEVYKLPRSLQDESGKEEMKALIKEMAKVEFEPVYATSHDGLKLFGRYYHVADGAPLQIEFHGYKSYGVRDFCGGNKAARERGHNTIIVDHRTHGQSEGKAITFGIKESRDCMSWAEYALERFGEDVPVILTGISMGGASVLMASGLDLPKNVKGIIADCPFSKPVDILKFSSKDMELPAIIKVLTGPFAVLGAAVFGRFNINETSAEEAVKNTKVPILIIHGEADRVVPHAMSEEVYKANPEMVRWETFPGAGHGVSYIYDTPRYIKLTNEFIDECLKEQ